MHWPSKGWRRDVPHTCIIYTRTIDSGSNWPWIVHLVENRRPRCLRSSRHAPVIAMVRTVVTYLVVLSGLIVRTRECRREITSLQPPSIHDHNAPWQVPPSRSQPSAVCLYLRKSDMPCACLPWRRRPVRNHYLQLQRCHDSFLLPNLHLSLWHFTRSFLLSAAMKPQQPSPCISPSPALDSKN